jgi:hypothetical protein
MTTVTYPQSVTSPQFWFATCYPAPTVGQCDLLHAIPGLADPQHPVAAIAVEVRRWPDMRWTVLVSIADYLDAPTVLHSIFGVSSDPSDADGAALFGLPVIEGQFSLEGETLRVDAVSYPQRAGAAPVSAQLQPLLTIDGLMGQVPGAGDSAFRPVYRQLLATPDIARPGSELVGRVLDSAPPRANVTRVTTPTLRVTFNTALYPDLFRLLSTGAVASFMWVGASGPFEKQLPADLKLARGSKLTRFDRVSVFGAPAFVFEEVEIVGFRTELPTKRALEPLIAALNFHERDASGRTGPIDFLYDIATPTVVIELLRYGKMRTSEAAPPFTADDFTSQHELLVRLLVGRVDDDTAQARDPALFVPAIFVDNPWSKFLGRRFEGFPKVLAEFYAGDLLVDMTGVSVRTGGKVPFHDLTEVRLVAPSSPRPQTILKIDCPDRDDGSDDAFIGVPVPTILGGTAVRRGRFDQTDFSDIDFRRSFARDVVAEQFNGYRVVQVSPVEDLGLPPAWISGKCELTKVEVAFPSGIATLQLTPVPSAPPQWQKLCAIIPQSANGVGFPTGDWYRVRCSMNLSVDDTLAW